MLCGTGPDINRTTETTYTPDSQVKTLTAVMANSADNQVTTYVYGTTISGGAGGQASDLVTNNLLFEVVYPDGTAGSDSVRLSYNRQAELTQRIDQAGTTHAYRYDLLGRLRHDVVTAFGAGIHEGVKRLTTEYEVRGMPSRLSSCMTAEPNGSATGGGVCNQVLLAYNGFGQLTDDYQEHAGHVDTAGSLRVRYGYENGANDSNQVRPIEVVYPSSRSVVMEYDNDAISEDMNRVTTLEITNASVNGTINYDYLGLGTVVKQSDSSSNAPAMDLWGGTAGTYTGLDRFDRVTDMHWQDDAGTPNTLARLEYGYDRDSMPAYCKDTVAHALSAGEDALFGRDGLRRLNDYQRGQLNGTNDAISTLAFSQDQTLDEVGNWSSFNQDNTGDGTNNLVQTRTTNKANEITGITNSVGGAWGSPTYDLVGNTTKTPSLEAPTDSSKDRQLTYDAWNRVVRVTDSSTSGFDPNRIAFYEYDARGFRVTNQRYPGSGTGADWLTHYYYTAGWQCIEERVVDLTVTPTPAPQLSVQYVWGLRYVDDLIQRQRDTTGDGVLDETLYAINDRQFNVVALTDTSQAVVQRMSYTPYGEVVFLTSAYAASTNTKEWEQLFQGLRLDQTALYDNRIRISDALTGRFVQNDPAGYPDGLNRYAAYHVMLATLDPFGLLEVVEPERKGQPNRKTFAYNGRITPEITKSDRKYFYDVHKIHFRKLDDALREATIREAAYYTAASLNTGITAKIYERKSAEYRRAVNKIKNRLSDKWSWEHFVETAECATGESINVFVENVPFLNLEGPFEGMDGHPDQKFTRGMAQISFDSLALATLFKVFKEIGIGVMGKQNYQAMNWFEKYIFTNLGIKGTVMSVLPWELRLVLLGHAIEDRASQFDQYRGLYEYWFDDDCDSCDKQ